MTEHDTLDRHEQRIQLTDLPDAPTSTVIESVVIPADEYVDLPQTVPPESLFDPAYVQIGQVTSTVSHMLEALGYPERAEPKAHDLRAALEEQVSTTVWREDREDYGTALEAALVCGRDVYAVAEEYDDVKANLGALDTETLATVRGTVGYVAPHFGIDVDLTEV